MTSLENTINVPLGLEQYRAAKAHWLWLFGDMDSSMYLGAAESPEEVVIGYLQGQFGAHPREARYISSIALDSVIEQSQQELLQFSTINHERIING